MAHVQKLSSGKWQGRYRSPENHREIARNFATKRDAQAWLDGVTAAVVRHDYADPRGGRVTVWEIGERWYATTATLKPLTRDSYRRLLDCHVLPKWGAIELRHVTTSGVAAWTADLASRRSASTTRKALVVLGQILDLAVADRLVAINPARSSVVRVPRTTRREMRALTADQLDRLADAMPSERDRMLTLILGYTGVRLGEGVALHRGDADVLRRRLRISRAVSEVRGKTLVGTPKTHQARSVTMTRSVAEALGAYMGTLEAGHDVVLFPDEVGGYVRPKWKARVFDRVAVTVGLTPPALLVHDLRHTAASLWIASGANVKVVQQQLGHKTASMTLDVYGHLFPDDLDLQAERLDALRFAAPADSARTVGSGDDVVAL